MLRGEIGSTVRLNVLRGNTREAKEITVTRQWVDPARAETWSVESSTGENAAGPKPADSGPFEDIF